MHAPGCGPWSGEGHTSACRSATALPAIGYVASVRQATPKYPYNVKAIDLNLFRELLDGDTDLSFSWEGEK